MEKAAVFKSNRTLKLLEYVTFVAVIALGRDQRVAGHARSRGLALATNHLITYQSFE